jgi:serine/threonine-protein kinase
MHDGTIEIFISRGPERYVVPELVGKTAAEAEEALAAAGIAVGEIDEEFHDEVAQGVVISQSVPAGDELRRDMTVSIVVSKGRQPIEIEDFTGRPLAEAEQALTAAGFKVVVDESTDPSVPAGTVISQEPSAGTGFRGDEIRLQVSADRKLRIPVPDVVGMDVAAARLLLGAVGFKIEVKNPGSGREVAAQSPRAGQLRELGSTVRLELRR